MSKGVIVLPPTAPTAPTATDTAASSAKDKAKDEAKEEGGEGGGGDEEPSPAAPPAASGADSSAWWERPWMIAAFRYGKATAAKGGGGNGGNGGKGGKGGGGGGGGDSGPPGVITALFDDAVSMASFEGSWSQGGSCGPWSLVRDCYLSFVLHRDMTMVSGDCIHS